MPCGRAVIVHARKAALRPRWARISSAACIQGSSEVLHTLSYDKAPHWRRQCGVDKAANLEGFFRVEIRKREKEETPS